MHNTPADASPSQHTGKNGRMVVAAGIGVDLWRPAKLGRQHHQRGVEQAAIGQIIEQAGECLIECAHFLGQLVPELAVHVPAPHLHFHHPHARFHQPAGEQAALSQRRAAIPAPGLVRFPGDIKRLQFAAAE